MTTEELLGDARALDLGPLQMELCRAAHQAYPEGFARICEATLGARNPSAALMKKLKAGAHKTGSPSDSIDLAGCVDMAQKLYQARVRKYPLTDQKGWTLNDAIAYGVDTATFQHSRFASADVERELRIRIGQPWTPGQDPALGMHNTLTVQQALGAIDL